AGPLAQQHPGGYHGSDASRVPHGAAVQSPTPGVGAGAAVAEYGPVRRAGAAAGGGFAVPAGRPPGQRGRPDAVVRPPPVPAFAQPLRDRRLDRRRRVGPRRPGGGDLRLPPVPTPVADPVWPGPAARGPPAGGGPRRTRAG